MEGVQGVITKDGKFLLGIEAKDKPYKGCWRLLGGRLEEGETHEEALKREFMEETGIVVDVHEKLGERKGEYIPITITILSGEYVSGALVPKLDEVAELRYFTLDEVKNLEMDGVSKSVFEEYYGVVFS